MTHSKAFQTAVELSDRGKHEDDARNYPTALPLYELAMDYYLQALKGRLILTSTLSFVSESNVQ